MVLGTDLFTDTDFVAVKRLDANGRLAVAAPIPWTSDDVG